jgi:hypothetical protein
MRKYSCVYENEKIKKLRSIYSFKNNNDIKTKVILSLLLTTMKALFVRFYVLSMWL